MNIYQTITTFYVTHSVFFLSEILHGEQYARDHPSEEDGRDNKNVFVTVIKGWRDSESELFHSS